MTLPACPRCGQTQITAGRCGPCDATDRQPAPQLALLEVPAVPVPAKGAAAPQSEGLFT